MRAARIVLSDRWPRIPFPVVGALLVTGYLLSLVVPAPYRVVLVMMVPLTVMIGTLAVTNVRGRRTFLGTRPMIWLGKISYAFYLTQAIVLFAVRPALFGDAEYGTAGGILLVLGLLATTVACAWLLHTCVERPAMKYLSRSRRTSPATPPDTARISSPSENGQIADDRPRRAA